jgi:hypothetical protein
MFLFSSLCNRSVRSCKTTKHNYAAFSDIRKYRFVWSSHRNTFGRPAENYAYHMKSAVLTAVHIKSTASSGLWQHVIRWIVSTFRRNLLPHSSEKNEAWVVKWYAKCEPVALNRVVLSIGMKINDEWCWAKAVKIIKQKIYKVKIKEKRIWA